MHVHCSTATLYDALLLFNANYVHTYEKQVILVKP